jgi:excisionase family DNA binding protein
VEPMLLRIQETARLLKVSKWTVYRWIEEGRLSATKIGRGSVRVFRTSVSGLIEEARINPSDETSTLPKKIAPALASSPKKKKQQAGGSLSPSPRLDED